MLKVCISFDYELFLGENYASYYDILFLPTEKIANELDKRNVSGTFFADVCSVWAHERLGLKEYSIRFSEQIKWLTSLGQDVQLHLHTNWLYANAEDGKVSLSDKGYRIQSFDRETMNSIIKEGKALLEQECRKANPNYRCIAYRAGGFAVQPVKDLFSLLLNNGICIDSSILPYMKSEAVNAYDFTNIPSKLNWWINAEKGLAENVGKSEASVFEVPVITRKPDLYYFTRNRKERNLPTPNLKGSYVKSSKFIPVKKETRFQTLKKQILGYRYPSLDGKPYKIIYHDLLRIYNAYGLKNKNGYICLICHPKLCDDVRLRNLCDLVELVKKDNRFEFCNMQDIYKEITAQ